MRTRPSGLTQERARPRRNRRALVRLVRLAHRVLGLGAGLLLIVAGLTGSLLVFRQEIDAALNPHLLRVPPSAKRMPLQVILDRVAVEYPGEEATRVRVPQRPDGVYEIWLGAAPARFVYADPGRGTLLGARYPAEFLTGWLFLLHSHLLSGAAGHTVAGSGALALVILALSGLVAWWPRRPPWRAWSLWRQSLTIATRVNVARTTYDLHRVMGFYASALLVIAGITGASLVFPAAFQRAAYVISASAPVPAAAAPESAAAAVRYRTVDTLLAIAARAQPEGVITYLYLPTAAAPTFRVRKRLPGEPHPTGKSFVHVEPATGRVLGVEDGLRAPRGARLYSVLYPLHIGVIGGWPTRVLASAAGLSIPLLAVTGTLVWWRRTVRWRRR